MIDSVSNQSNRSSAYQDLLFANSFHTKAIKCELLTGDKIVDEECVGRSPVVLSSATARGIVILRLSQVKAILGLSRSAIYYRMNKSSQYFDETFPKPVRLGNPMSRTSAIGWIGEEIDDWIRQQVTSRDTTGSPKTDRINKDK